MKKTKTMVALMLSALLLAALAMPTLAETVAPTTAPAVGAQPISERASTGDQTNRKEAKGGRHTFVFGDDQTPKHGTKTELTQEQKDAIEAAYVKAEADQIAAQHDYLAALVTAGILSQAELDAYDRMAELQKTAKDIDTLQWTMAKNVELQEAMQKTGAELQAALAPFVTEGLLTEAQVNALLVNTKNWGIDYLPWTVGQVKDVQAALQKTSAECIAALDALVAQGLLSQSQADAMLSQRLSSLIRRGSYNAGTLTEEQETAGKTAWEALQARYEEIQKEVIATISE